MKQLNISLRELYKDLNLCCSHYAKWYKRNLLNNSYFKENIDWIYDINNKNTTKGGRYAKNFYISNEFACYIINQCKTVESDIKINTLKKYNLSKKVDITSKFECEFSTMIKNFLKEWNVNIEQQVLCCNKYRLDFVINGNIAVEYDEEHHREKINLIKDELRIKEINEWYNKKTNNESNLIWIRIKKGKEIEGLGKISFELAKQQSLLDCGIYDNYKIDKFIFNEAFEI